MLDQPVQNTAAESSNLIENERLADVEESSTSSQKKGKKNYPKKSSPGRKRILNKENWIAEIRKRKKNLGEEFTNRKGQIIPKKEIKPSCGDKCSRKCRELITENQRNTIFNNFWSLGDHNKQADYLSRFIKRVSRKQIMARSASSSRRKCSYEYYLYVDGQEIRTCKVMFLNTFSISDMWVQTLFKKINNSATGTILNDIRGNRLRKNVIPDHIKQSIRNHISEMPLVDSHYVRSRSSKQYLDAELSLPILYKLYTEFMKEKHPEQEVATSRQYRQIFITEFNIEFNKPKKDQCPKCDIFRNASEIDKSNLEYDFALHIANKEVVRTLKDIDKSRAKNSDSVVTAVYDLQKILNTPQSEVSIFYYKRKLATYNFTIFDMGKRVGYCYVWNETIGRKGSNEISSFVFDFIKMKVQEGYTEFNFYSDSCGGQNKNRIVFSMYAYASKMFNITTNHHFFEVGHSQNEGDAMHALIERKKKYKVIYVPQQWVTLIRCAKSTGSPYIVKEVNQDDIFDYKQLLSFYKNWDRDVNNVKVTWNKIMHIQFISSLPNIITFQYDSLSDTDKSINIAEVSRRSGTRRSAKEPQNNDQNINIPMAYNGRLPISEAKYKDLINLCNSKAIPEIYHDYFKNLPHYHQDPHISIEDDQD